MSNAKKILIAKLLILNSFILMFIGTVIDVVEKRNVVDPNKAVVVGNTKDDNSEINITLTDSPNGVVDNTNEENNNSTGTNGGSSVPNGSGNNNNNNNNNSSNAGNSSYGGVVAPPKNNQTNNRSINDINNEIRTNIFNVYGITVKYGSETANYSVGGLGTYTIDDNNVVNNSLVKLSGVLALYPDGFFQEIKNGGIPLTILLIKGYTTKNVTGVTDSSFVKATISVASDYDLVDSINHELYHYIDRYISKQGGNYASWSSLNPMGFKYGNITNSNSYDRTFSEDAYFVNNYAQSDEYEDRSSTFEYMMANNKAGCLNYERPVWYKARYMAETIDLIFNTVSPNKVEYWERFIY